MPRAIEIILKMVIQATNIYLYKLL